MATTTTTKKKPTKTTTKRKAAEKPIPFVPTPQAAPQPNATGDGEEYKCGDAECACAEPKPIADTALMQGAERVVLQGARAPRVDNLRRLTLGELVIGALSLQDRSHDFADGVLDSIAADANILDAAMFERHDEVCSEDLRAFIGMMGNRARYGAELARRLSAARSEVKP